MSKAKAALLLAIALVAAPGVQLRAQSQECPPSQVLLHADDPVSADAIELSRGLQAHGFLVQCIFPTKLGSIFMVNDHGVVHSTIEGEACFVTDHGSFDVIFVPKPQTFADFKITEHRQGGGYLYRFSGSPRVHGGKKFKFGTAQRNYFLKHDNRLLIVSDEKLRARLDEVLSPPAVVN